MHLTHRHLVGTPETFGLLAINFFWAGPSLWRTQNDHWPKRSVGLPFAISAALDALDLFNDDVQCRRHELVHLFRFVSLHEIWRIAVAAEEMFQFFVADSSQHTGIGDLVAVEVKDWQNHSVGGWI